MLDTFLTRKDDVKNSKLPIFTFKLGSFEVLGKHVTKMTHFSHVMHFSAACA